MRGIDFEVDWDVGNVFIVVRYFVCFCFDFFTNFCKVREV